MFDGCNVSTFASLNTSSKCMFLVFGEWFLLSVLPVICTNLSIVSQNQNWIEKVYYLFRSLYVLLFCNFLVLYVLSFCVFWGLTNYQSCYVASIQTHALAVNIYLKVYFECILLRYWLCLICFFFHIISSIVSCNINCIAGWFKLHNSVNDLHYHGLKHWLASYLFVPIIISVFINRYVVWTFMLLPDF